MRYSTLRTKLRKILKNKIIQNHPRTTTSIYFVPMNMVGPVNEGVVFYIREAQKKISVTRGK